MCGCVRTAELTPKILKEGVEPTKHDEEPETHRVSESQRSKEKDEEDKEKEEEQ